MRHARVVASMPLSRATNMTPSVSDVSQKVATVVPVSRATELMSTSPPLPHAPSAVRDPSSPPAPSSFPHPPISPSWVADVARKLDTKKISPTSATHSFHSTVVPVVNDSLGTGEVIHVFAKHVASTTSETPIAPPSVPLSCVAVDARAEFASKTSSRTPTSTQLRVNFFLVRALAPPRLALVPAMRKTNETKTSLQQVRPPLILSAGV